MIRSVLFTILACCVSVNAHAAELYATTERDGTVALCLSKGALVFADRCEGSGRLSIIEPIKEGTVVWRSATGTITMENDTRNPECALGKAKWDPKDERVVSTGRKLKKADRTEVLNRLTQYLLKDDHAVVEDVEAFELDLDGDGREETVFTASNWKRLPETVLEKPIPYFIYAGVLARNSLYPSLFYDDRGDYRGGTDAIGEAEIKGVVPIAPGTGELALLIKAGSRLHGRQTLIRYRLSTVQRIDVIEFNCN